MLFKETKAIQIPRKVQELPEEGEFWMEEKYWYGGPASGGWCGWKVARIVRPTNHPEVFSVYERQFFVNTSDYSRNEDDQEYEEEYLVKLISL